MPRLLILKLDDGDAIGEKLSKEMGAFAERVEVKSLYDFDPSDGLKGCVTVVILTSLVCQEIRRIQQDAWKKILVHSSNTIVLVYCRPDGENIFGEFCRSLGVENAKLRIYNVHRNPTDYYMAESQIKIMLSILGNRQSTIDIVPKERRFAVKPNVVTKGTKEVTVVLFEDFPNIRSLSTQVTNTTSGDTVNPKAKRLRNGVWVLDTSDLKPGKNTIQLNVDNEDIGEEIVTVQSELQAAEEALGKVMRSDPKRFVEQLLQIKGECFDDAIADILGESSSYLFQNIFQWMTDLASRDEKDNKVIEIYRTNIFHFLARNGCTRSVEVVKRNLTSWNRLCSEQNKEGDTPLNVAKKFGNFETHQALASDSNEEKFEKTTSPLCPDWTPRRTQTVNPRLAGPAPLSRDSGVSTGSNFGSDGRLETPRTSPRRVSDSDVPFTQATPQRPNTGSRERYEFLTRAPHHYDEIEESDPPFRRPRDPQYDEPWEKSPLPQGQMPQQRGTKGNFESTLL